MNRAAPRRANLVALAATRLVLAASGLVVNVELIRLLPRHVFGTFQWITSLVGLSMFLATFGLPTWITREVSRHPSSARATLGASLRLVSALGAVAAGLIVAYVSLRGASGEVRWAAVLGGATLAAMAASQMVEATLHGLRRMFVELPAVLSGRAWFVIGQLTALYAGMGLVELYSVRLSAAVLTLAVLLASAWRILPRDESARIAVGYSDMLRAGAPFAATMMFGGIYAQADVLMLELMVSEVEVARYAAPARVLLQLALFANVISKGFYPRVSQLDEPAAVQREVRFMAQSLLLVGLPVLCGGLVVAEPLIAVVSSAYMDAVVPFAWLLAAVPLVFLNNGMGLALAARGRERARARIDMTGALLNVALNLVFIPVWGAAGAAATTLATGVALQLLLVWQLQACCGGLRLVPVMLRAAVPSVLMAAVVYGLGDLHVLLRIGIGVGVYPVLALATGAVRREDLRRWIRV